MRYEVRFVEGHQLPAGHDWMMIQTATECFVFVRDDAVCPTVIEQAWAAFRARQVAQPLSA